jgi:hypothetical protein
MKKAVIVSIAFALGLLAAGCSPRNDSAVGSGVQSVSEADRAKYVLASEPAGAKGVISLRKEVKDGDEVVVLGRVGGSASPLVKGRAAFTVVDASLTPCNEKAGDECQTPWDYCCDPPEEIAKASAMIKFVDEQGKTLPHDASDLLGIKPLQTVVVRGKAKRDESGNLTVLASGLFVRR